MISFDAETNIKLNINISNGHYQQAKIAERVVNDIVISTRGDKITHFGESCLS